ncbi:MAG: DUF423 domain-containing protein [Planctomycetaceae bacterium]
MTTSRLWLFLGAILSGLAVAAGAFAAHGLDRHFQRKYAGLTYQKSVTLSSGEMLVLTTPLAEKLLADFKTGAEYQMYHALALLAVGLLAGSRTSKSLSVAGLAFLLGIVCFSGGLFAYALLNAKWIGIFVVPVGGTLFLLGWGALAWSISPWRNKRQGDFIQIAMRPSDS